MRTETISWAVRGAGLAVGVGFVLLLAFLAGAARDILLLVFLAVLSLKTIYLRVKLSMSDLASALVLSIQVVTVNIMYLL